MSLAYGSNDRPHHSHPQTPSPTLSSAALAYAVLVLLLIYHALQYFDYLSLPASELLWNAFVYLTPLSLISALDARSEPRSPQGKTLGYQAPASEKHAAKSETMRRILGLDGAGILTAVQRTRTVSSLGNLFQIRPSGSPPGLGNWDNSCYQNSVIQGLASLPSLSTFLGRVTKVDESHSTQAALAQILFKLNDPSNAGKLFWTPAGLKSMSSWQQQDAQEYFSKIMDDVEKEISKTIKSKSKQAGLALEAAQDLQVSAMNVDDAVEKLGAHNILPSSKAPTVDQLPDELGSVIARSPLEGLLAQRVGCLTCGYVEGLSVIPFTCLTVPLGKQWMYDIRTCLDEYTNLEPINGVECVKCTLLHNKKQLERLRSQFYNQDTGDPNPLAPPLSFALQSSIEDRLAAVNSALDEEDFSDNTILKKCQIPARSRISTTKSRQAIIARAPQALVIHVNRSVFNEFNGVQSKNLANVRFPLIVDLASWCLGSPPPKSSDTVETESWNMNPSVSMLPAEDDSENLNCKEMYELRAVITHYGRHENGHYICYRKFLSASTPEGGAVDPWWRFSDEEVSQVSEENVLSQGGVFMLFYEKAKLQEPKEGERAISEQEASIAADCKPEQVQVNLSLEETAIELETSHEPIQDSACDAITTEISPNASEINNAEPVSENHPRPTAAASSVASSKALTTAPAPKTSHPPATPSSTTQPPTSHIPTPTSHIPQSPPPALPTASPPPPAPLTTATFSHSSTTAVDNLQDITQEPRKLTPPPMRTAGPLSGRGGKSRAGKAMGMGMGGGMVEAN